MKDIKTQELKELYRDTQLHTLDLHIYYRKFENSLVGKSLRLLEKFETILKKELLERKEDI